MGHISIKVLLLLSLFGISFGQRKRAFRVKKGDCGSEMDILDVTTRNAPFNKRDNRLILIKGQTVEICVQAMVNPGTVNKVKNLKISAHGVLVAPLAVDFCDVGRNGCKGATNNATGQPVCDADVSVGDIINFCSTVLVPTFPGPEINVDVTWKVLNEKNWQPDTCEKVCSSCQRSLGIFESQGELENPDV